MNTEQKSANPARNIIRTVCMVGLVVALPQIMRAYRFIGVGWAALFGAIGGGSGYLIGIGIGIERLFAKNL